MDGWGGYNMGYPYAALSDITEVVHSEMKADGRVKVYIEKAVYGGFHSATCYLPDYTWESIAGFSDEEMAYYKEFVENNIHLFMEFAKEGDLQMPQIFKFGSYIIFLWSNENKPTEPIHVHIAEKCNQGDPL